jgi:hypothetical protein
MKCDIDNDCAEWTGSQCGRPGGCKLRPSSCSSPSACSVSCAKCGDTDILKRYIEPKPVYSGGSYRGETREYMAYRCQSCSYVWRGPTLTQNAGLDRQEEAR